MKQRKGMSKKKNSQRNTHHKQRNSLGKLETVNWMTMTDHLNRKNNHGVSNAVTSILGKLKGGNR